MRPIRRRHKPSPNGTDFSIDAILPDSTVASFSSNLPDFFFYEVEKETDKPNSEAIDLFRSTDL